MPKKKSLRKLVDDVAVQLQKHVRLKEAVLNDGYVRCWYSGEMIHWKEADGCHYISRTHQATKILEENIHPGKKGLNLRAGRGDSLLHADYRRNMVEFYGEEFVDQLERSAREPIKYSRPDLEDQLKDLRKRNRELEAQL